MRAVYRPRIAFRRRLSLADPWTERPDPACDVHCVVAEALVEAADESELDRNGDGHAARDDLGGQRDMAVIHLVVELLDGRGHVRRAIGEGVGGLAPHARGQLSHLLDEPPAARTHLASEAAHGAPGDVLGEVAAALDLGEHAQDGDEHGQLVEVQPLVGDPLQDLVFDLALQRIDDLVGAGELDRGVAIGGEKGVGRAGKPFADEGEELDDLPVDRLLGRDDHCRNATGREPAATLRRGLQPPRRHGPGPRATSVSSAVGPTRGGPMGVETVELSGHIIDSLVLAKVLDAIVAAGATYRITALDVGARDVDPSRARIEIASPDDQLRALIEELHEHGVHLVDEADATLVSAERDGVLPEGFYPTTNLATSVRVGGSWVSLGRPEMDCALVVDDGGAGAQARAVPMHRVSAGDRVVVGFTGVRVEPPGHSREGREFQFMGSETSSEKPKSLVIHRVAERMRAVRACGEKVLAVCGPAVVHTGAAPDLATMVRAGWIDVLFAGNGFATHDIESNTLGTSLGVTLAAGEPVEHGHANHLRVINEVRRHGSIKAAVGSGYLRGGVMYECVRAEVPFVLGGSVRDDGPLPDTMTDVVAAADAMRELLDGVSVALMLASTLHAIAVGNLLPAWVETYCIDINQAVVTKLSDRGSHQALGIVTDVGLFLAELSSRLCA